MSLKRILFSAAGAITALVAATPATAQFYLNPPKFATGPVTGAEPGIALPLPGATPEEQMAGLVWTMRSGLNVAALQCSFEPTLLTLSSYNAILGNHQAELKRSFDTLSNYFRRTNKTVREGTAALDVYGTKTYQNFAAVSSQRMFCQTAGSVVRDALWAPKGGLAKVASERMRELRASLTYAREPQTVNPWISPVGITANLPNLDDQCWDRRDRWRARCDRRGA